MARFRYFLLLLLGIFYVLFYAKGYTSQDVLNLLPEERKNLKKEDVFPLLEHMSKAERVAFWAEFFVGTVYDKEPIGNYVLSSKIVQDEAFDCMSHVFRSTEMGLSQTETEAMDKALNLRFVNKGERIGNYVKSYENRYEYGEDMAFSGKYGRNVTKELGDTVVIEGSRSYKTVDIVETKNSKIDFTKLKSGDVVFLIKNVEKRKVGEIVGHLGIIKAEGGEVYFIHASGVKNKGGVVKKVDFKNYLDQNYPYFIGFIVTRF